MPHLSQLQRDYKDKNVTIIGMTSEDRSNSLEAVKKMVEAKGDGMAYSVAWDDGQKTNDAWMKASGQRGIPSSFLVDKTGKIAWIGHPGALDYPLAAVVDGSWDPVKGPELMKSARKAQSAIGRTARKDPKKALELLEQFEKDYPLFAKDMENVRFEILVAIPEEKAAAEKVGAAIVSKAIAAEDAMALNEFAWKLVDPAVQRENRFLDLAFGAAIAANVLTEEKDAAILDTVGRVYFWKGDLEKAIEVQRSAVEHATGRMKADLEKALEEYELALEEKQ